MNPVVINSFFSGAVAGIGTLRETTSSPKTTLLFDLPKFLCWFWCLWLRKIVPFDRNPTGREATQWWLQLWFIIYTQSSSLQSESRFIMIYYLLRTLCIYEHTMISQHALVHWLDHSTNAKGPFHLHGVPTLITVRFSEATTWGVAPDQDLYILKVKMMRRNLQGC